MEEVKNLITPVPESVHRAIKQEAAERGITMTEVVRELIQPLIARRMLQVENHA
ncbi:hypothetical protein [Celeribacter sp. PS-C1]|uniref:hypothetical protein n=1 Tax=Celeribacter sp. PS-C1 TaxID=2820813 RepID=UPI001CA54931|nr:hypothetical protein [Celeribacter sp. PS-C1]MBW6419506.1 hypothetical protein [Celeribacter sp. PS-C1]